MSIQIEKAYKSISELNLWFSVRDSVDLTLTDIVELIPYRWNYFKDNWFNIKQGYINKVDLYSNPDLFSRHIDDFSSLILAQNNLIGKNPFADSNMLYRFYTIYDNTSIYELPLTREERLIVEKNLNKVKGFIRKDFNRIRKDIVIARDYIADITDTADHDYNSIFNRSPVQAQLNIDNKNINLMFHFQESIKTVDFILANIFSLETTSIDPFALAKQNANNTSIDISTYNSGKLKRFNHGESMQDIAQRELGDSDKWIDIAIANGLKPPYIDEVGRKLNLLSNANGNQLNIAGSTNGQLNADQLFVNQIILLKSDVYPFPDQRIITNIKHAPVSGEMIIEVNGEPDLNKYKINENASIRFYKPNTINSSFLILIPSKEEVLDEVKQDTPWFLRSSGESEKRQKIDLMLKENGDLNFTSSDDIQLSFGLENAIQALKLKLSVENGELEKHADFGIIPIQGMKNDNYKDIEDFLAYVINTSISKDPRYDRVEQLKVSYFNENKNDSSGVGFIVKVEVRLAGSDSVIPITFSVDM